jgi:hypothetical protein
MRAITFPKTSAGVWTNRETGVIVRLELDGSGYRAFRPADVTTGYIGICQTVRTLAEARYHAARYVRDSFRHTIAVAFDEAWAMWDRIELHGACVAHDAIRCEWCAPMTGAETACEEAHVEALAEDKARAWAAREEQFYAWELAHSFMLYDDAITADHAEALAMDRGYPSGQSRNWHEQTYRRAVEMDAAAPHMGHAADALIDEAHAEALEYDAALNEPRCGEPDCGEVLRDIASGYVGHCGIRCGTGCTAAHSWTEPHLFEDDEIELNREGYDEYERCGKPADDPLHIEGAHAAALRSNDQHDYLAQSEKLGRARRVREIRENARRAGQRMGLREALQAVKDEDHAEAITMDAARIIEAARAPQNAIGASLPPAPEDVSDDEAWAAYCAAMPAPSDDEITAVLAEYGNPYAGARAQAVDAFKGAARTLWRMRAEGGGRLHRDVERSIRRSMKLARDVIGVYDALTEQWRADLLATAKRDEFSTRF